MRPVLYSADLVTQVTNGKAGSEPSSQEDRLRSDQPFFYQPWTTKRIVEIAGLPRLVVYAGLGATIDRIGLSWRGLISRLMVRALQGRDEETVKMVLDQLGPVNGASIVLQLLDEMFEDPSESEGRLRNELRMALYGTGGWRKGKLTDQLSLLVVERSLKKYSTAVVTTNYDDFLERSLRTACDLSRRVGDTPGVVRSHSVPLRSNYSIPTRRLDLVYLHGKISPHDHDRPVSPPTIGEADYLVRGQAAQELLTRALERSAMFIVGSSITDAPLVNALLSTRKSANVHPRFALISLQGPEWAARSNGERERLVNIASARFRHLAVQPIYTDFFCQVPQFVHELSLAARQDPLSYKSDRYVVRLERWWARWHELHRPFDGTRYARTQEDHHGRLRAALRDIAGVSAQGRNPEILKLEVWLRWDPSETSRRLRLWASSSTSYRYLNAHRDDQIEAESKYVSVQAFCEGRPITRDPDTGRWARYLASPIWLRDEVGELVVGVITLATMRSEGILGDRNLNGRYPILETMQKVGLEISRPTLVVKHAN